ncbi:MAG: hypothetical protein NC086_11625 [Alistipes sp.]|nr:hypothetical protein [Alistipes sp.]
MRDEKVVLITQYKAGKEIKEENMEVYAEKKSVKYGQFTASYAAGLDAKYILDIYPQEYRQAGVTVDGIFYEPSHVLYMGKRMDIIRTYSQNEYSMEVTVGYGKRKL